MKVDDTREAWDIQETLNEMYAEAFVAAATETNEQTGKLLNPNIDSQKAATTLKLLKVREDMHQLEHREILRDIQKIKNSIVCEHERRGDLKAEIELLKLLRDES